MKTRLHPAAGVTLMEVLIAVTLLSLLSLGMMFAMRLGLDAYTKTDNRLMDNRRVAGAQRVIMEEIEGLMPVVAPCGANPVPGTPAVAFFQAETQTMRFVSTFSLQQGWRGVPHILEIFTIPGAEGRGVRLVVNEIPYTGPLSAGRLCTTVAQDPVSGQAVPRFVPAQAGPDSFVLADKLAMCTFSYLVTSPDPKQLWPIWNPRATRQGWPFGVRIEMGPLENDPSRLQPYTITAPIHLHRSPDIPYVD